MHTLRLLTLMAVICATKLPVLSCYAHPFHTSLTEMDWNPQASCWEVGMRVCADDLEVALQKLHPDFVLDAQNSENSIAVKQISAYIQSQFHWADDHSPTTAQNEPATRRTSPIRWIGMESEGSWLWLYFEFHPPKQQGDLKLFHRLLLDVNADQLNVVSVRNGPHRYSVQTHSQLDHFLLHRNKFSISPQN